MDGIAGLFFSAPLQWKCNQLFGCYVLGVRLVEALVKVFLVEPHGGDDAARGPVDHHVSQQIIQRELPARQSVQKSSSYGHDSDDATGS